MMLASTRVLFVRHGQSEWNLEGRWQGQADPPLTDLGRAQARSAARALGQVEAIWASDLQRAAETAAIISNELGVGPVVLDAGIRERDVGEWAGLTRNEIDEQFPGSLPPLDSKNARGTTVRRPPSWEPDESVLERVTGVLRQIRDEVGPGEVLAVAHAGILYALERALGASGDRLGNLEGRWFELKPATDGKGSAAARGEPLELADLARLGDRMSLLPDNEVTVPRNL